MKKEYTQFLLNKVAAHIREWKQGNKTPLQVGILDSHRNILHASDVANAIHMIISQEKSNTYLICNDLSHKVYDLVVLLNSLSGIDIEKRGNDLYEKSSSLQTIIIKDIQLGFDSTPTNIRGEATKLKELGWKPLQSIEKILEELI